MPEDTRTRNASDAPYTARFLLYLETVCRDVVMVTLWLDNCSAQNKDRPLLTVNAQETTTRCVMLQRTFEAGTSDVRTLAVLFVWPRLRLGHSFRAVVVLCCNIISVF